MLRTLIVTSLTTLTLTSATAAFAGDADAFGSAHQVMISADRLMPLFAYESQKETTNAGGQTGSTTNTVTSVALVGNGLHETTFYNLPRFAVDYTIIPNLTIGGSVYGFFTLGSSTTDASGGTSTSQDNTKITIWGIAPRVGYIIPFSSAFAFWPRGGISFQSLATSTPDNNQPPQPQTTTNTNLTQWAVDLEPMFAWTPVTHAAITFGGVIDIPLTGSNTSSNSANSVSVSTDTTQFHFGVTAGLLIYL